MPKDPPADDPTPQWEACAPDVTPFGRPVQILGREWAPGVWQDVTEAERAILERNYGVLLVREKGPAEGTSG